MLNQLRSAGFGLIILTLVLTFNGAALAHEHGGAIEARQREYEHGYRDGYHHGRDDRARNATRESEDYEHGDRGHQPYIGSKDNYKKGTARATSPVITTDTTESRAALPRSTAWNRCGPIPTHRTRTTATISLCVAASASPT